MQYDDCLLHLPLVSHIRTCACLNLTSNRWTRALGLWRLYFAWCWLSGGCTLVIGLIMSLFALDFLFAMSTFKLIISTVFPHLYDWTGYMGSVSSGDGDLIIRGLLAAFSLVICAVVGTPSARSLLQGFFSPGATSSEPFATGKQR